MASWNDLQAARQNDLMRYYNSKVVQQDQATPQSAALQEKKNKGGFLGGVGYTLEKLGLGTLRSIEGMTDYLVGGAADILGQDDFAEELMKSDWVNYEHADEWYNPNKVMSFVGDVSSGVGGMLPSITAAAAVTGGAGAGVGAGLLSQGVGTALFGLGAAGQSTSQAVKETGTLGGKEWLYGTGSGALEAGIEAASGGIGGTLAGTAFGKQLAKTTGGKIATTFLGEGLEEVASDITDPLLKKATGVDKNAKVDWSNLPRTFLVGGATGAVLGGAGRAINAAKAGGFNNLGAIETANKLTKEKAKVNLQQVNDKAFEQEQPQVQSTEAQEQTEQAPTPTVVEENQKPIKYAYTPQEIRETENKLGERVQKMDEKTRQEFMESNPQATRNLNEDGTVKPAVTVTQEEIDTYDKNSYSASLQGHEGELKFKPAKKAAQAVKSIMKNLTKLTQGKAEIVLTDDDLGTAKNGKKINAVVSNGVVYLKSDATDTERTMFLGSHEIMHTLEGTREYSNLAKFIQNEIKNNPRMRLKYNLDDYISAYAGAQEQNYSNYTKLHEAQTEMYADFIANEVLSKPESVQRLVNENRNIVVRMLQWVRDAIKRIGMTKDERETYDTLRRMEKLLSNALEAGRGGLALDSVERRYQERKAQEQTQETAKEKPFRGTLAAERYSFSSISNSFFGEELTVEDFESKDYKEMEGYKEYVDKCLSNMKQTREDFNEEEARKEITNSIDGIVKVAVAMKKAGYDILDDSDQREAVDSKNRKLFSSLEPNSDYFTSSDISTICDKRRNFTSIYEDIVEREEKANVPADKRFFNNIDNYFYIHEVMAKLGLTTACRQCYVESMRKNLAPMARAFITLVTEPNANNKANRQLFDNKGNAKATNTRLRENVLNAIAENDYSIKAADLTYTMLTTADGLAQLKLQAPIVYESFNSFYGQAKPKMPKKATPFRFGELTALLTDNKGKINEGLVNRINKTGGFRLQSYSDFQMENYADVLQVIFEAGTLGLTGHAYTKVPAFLDATANTNLKRNISVFMYEDNGKWIIDKGDSFPATMEQLADIVKADKSGNTGVIAVVQNEKMAAYVMVNDNIAYFIPYHKSGMKMDVVRETIVKDKGREILGYKNIKDHTKMQSETWKTNTDEHKQFTKVKTPIDIYSFWDFDNVDNLPKKELIEKNVKEYINRCEAAGYYPKFRNYVMNNEAVLKDMVTYAKELGIDASLDTLTFKYKEYTIPYGYYKCLGDFSMFKPNGEASPHEVLSLKNYKFNEAVKFFDDSKKLSRTEILQQIANGELREELAKSDLTDKQIEEIVKQKRTKAADIALEERGYKGKNERFSVDLDDISDFDAITFAKWFDELTIEDLEELIGDNAETEIKAIEKLPTKQERRDAYVARMYKQGNLNEAITKIVKKHPQMQAYFKNTKVNQKYNPLYRTKGDEYIVMFHGTPSKFNVFDTKKIGKHGTVMGSGLYFTESLRYAEDYKTDDGRVMATLLNIEKPLSRNKITMTKEDLKRFIREVVDMDGDDFLSNYGDVYSLGYEKLLDKTVNKLYDYHTNEADLIEDIYVTSRMDFDDFHNGLTDLLGYDGIIAWNKAEGTQAVVFRSNQAKDIFNFNPTKNEDIRYSLDVAKVYTSRDMENVVDNLTQMMIEIGDIDTEEYNVAIQGKKALAEKYAQLLNSKATTSTKSAEERASLLVDEILERTVITRADNYMYENAQNVIETLRPYYHSMDLRSIKSEILNDADYKLFSGGEKGMAWDSVLMEILEENPWMKKDNVGNEDIETLLSIFDEYRNAQSIIRERKIPIEKAVLNLADTKSWMKKQLSYSLEETGTEYKKKRAPEYMTDEEWEATLKKEHEDDGRVAKFQRVTQEKEKLTKKERIQRVKENVADKWLRGQIETTNQQAGIEHAGKKLGVDLEPKIQKARASQSAAINMVTNEQRDYTGKKRVGKSIEAIFGPIIKQGDKVYDDFLEYLGHFHNIDSMSMEDKAKAEIIKLVRTNEALAKIVKQKNINETERKQKLQAFEEGRRYLELSAVENKPVYGWSVSAEESKERIQELNEKYKDFFAKAQEVWGYNKNLIQRRVDAGLITQELGDELLARYPHYIPTFRDTSKSGVATTGTSNSKNAVEVRKTIRTRKGSSADIIDVMLSMSKQTQAVLRAEAVNDLANALYDAAEAQNDFTDIEIISKTKVQDEAKNSEEGDIDYEAEKPKNNEVVFYRDGERIVAAVSQPVFVGFESFNGSVQFKGPLVGLLEKWMNIFKSSVTAWNPLFTIRNFIRDFQEAAFYTKHGVGKFSANLPKAIAAMKRKSDLWQQYLAIGGIQSGFFDKDTGIFDSSGKIKKGLKAVGGKISLINEFVEQIPRFNEFMLSVESGKSIEQALLDSADVTTNFSRGGKLTKVANRTLFPFLNASVQGFSKLWRTVSGRKAAREWASLIVKATLFGLSVGLINDLINGDDEEYEKLNMREKENNYILKAGDVFIKIPKGRVVAFLGSFVGRTKDFVSGKEDAFDEWGTSAMSMVTPVDSVTRTIFAPFFDVKSNTTWYGGQIEGQRLQNYAPSQRYDESTSSIAIALGKVFNYSPKKIHYLIDQYSGVFGDVLLPLTTNKAERGMIESAFTIDPVTQNNISNEFYDTLDSLTWAKNAGDPISAILLRYMNKASNGASDLYQQKRDIQNDKSLSNKEKQKQTKIIQATINTVLQSATQNVEKLEQILIDLGYEDLSVKLLKNAEFKKFDEKQQVSATQKFTDYYYASAMAELVGEKKDVKYYFYDEVGGADTAIYLTEIAAITSDKDKNGKSIANSRKTKVHNYIEKLKISALQKYMLMYLAGYTPSENGKQKIEQYLTKKGYKQEDLVGLWD